MKLKLIAFLLALTVMSWAQSTTPAQAPAPEQKSTPADAKAACPCCEKMATAAHGDKHKGKHACMDHDASAKDGKEAMSCCSGKDAKGEMACCGKDAKACVKDDKSSAKGDQSAAACCGAGKCGEGHEMACCAAKDGDAASHGCCSGGQCGKHEHKEHAAPGN